MKKIIVLIIMLGASLAIFSQGYLHVDGKMIKDGNGDTIILRGMGLGGWMLQEGYMLGTESFANPQHEIEAAIEDVAGAAGKEAFYNKWLANHCTKADIDSLKRWGFNSVRLPMHYNLYTPSVQEDDPTDGNVWLETGFALTDSLLNWCAQNEMYLILDLHAAPGGQGEDYAISDGSDNWPRLWEDPLNMQKTVDLWKKLAERYVDEPWIGGYDLINETNYSFSAAQGNLLADLYLEITDSIRTVDNNHIIFIEGNWWANDFTGLTPPWDNNMVYSFHKYWSNNDQGSIQWMLNIRNTHNVPLWLGESGENSNQWFRDAIKLCEDNKIGWAWWPMKKFGSITNPMTIETTEGWDILKNYWSTGTSKPTQEDAIAILDTIAENLKIENCIYRHDVIDAMFRQVQENTSVPFKNITLPSIIDATEFDYGSNGVAYNDQIVANYHVSTNSYTAWNNGWAFRNDGVDIEPSSDTNTIGNGFNVGWTEDDEWLQYTINVPTEASYAVDYRIAGNGGIVHFELNGAAINDTTLLTSTGGWQTWETQPGKRVILPAGEQKLRLYIDKAGFNFNYFELKDPVATNTFDFELAQAATNEDGTVISVSFNKALSSATNTGGFSITVDGIEITITSVELSLDSDNTIKLNLGSKVYYDQEILITYTPGTVQAEDFTTLQAFTDRIVVKNVPVLHNIPGTLQAEEFNVNNGFVIETDESNHTYLAYAAPGDYTDYNVKVGSTGGFTAEYRYASTRTNNKATLIFMDEQGTEVAYDTVSLNSTGGWFTFDSQKSNLMLEEGRYTMRFKIISGEFNTDYFKFTEGLTSIKESKNFPADIAMYPNPATNLVTFVSEGFNRSTVQFSILRMDGRILKSEIVEFNHSHTLDLTGLQIGLHYIQIIGKNKTYVKQLLIK